MTYKRYKSIYKDATFKGYLKYFYKSKIKKILRIPYCTYMCIKYPFLYPRNRFTDKYHANILGNLIYKLHHKSVFTLHVTGKLNDKVIPNQELLYADEIHQTFDNGNIILDNKNKKLIISNNIDKQVFDLNQLLWQPDKFRIIDMNLIKNKLSMIPYLILNIENIDKGDNKKYGFSYYTIKLKTNKFLHALYKITKWIDEKILDKIFCLPTYTEWDAVEHGWNKAFGKQYLKELKQQLKKDNILYKWRITQIKEKWGRFVLYCNYASPELYSIIDKYNALSWDYCINCGKPATHQSIGWISPYCEDCVNKSNKPEKYKNK